MTCEPAGASGGLAGLGARLRRAGQAALHTASGGAGGVAGLLAQLEQIGVCLEEAEQRLRRGERDTDEGLRGAVESWRTQARQLATLVDGAMELASGYAASAGLISGYGPSGAGPGQKTGCRLDESG